MKGRVAIWTHGGIGGGSFSQGQPPVQQLIGYLAEGYGIDIYSLTAPHPAFTAERYRIFHVSDGRTKVYSLIWLFRKFLRQHREQRYGIIYGLWGYPAGVIAVGLGKMFRIPSVIHLQGGDAVRVPSLGYGVFNHPVRAIICRLSYNAASRLIAISQFQADSLRQSGIRRKPLIIPYGPDTSIFEFRRARFDKAEVRFLHVGNQTPVKGQHMMLEVFALVARSIPSRLVIVGGDYYDGKLRQTCRSLAIEHMVEFAGPQPHHAMAGFYHNADVLLHTPFYEGQGVVFAEAAACGSLLAGTRVGMLADMGDSCAIVVSQRNSTLLAEKIITALKGGQDSIRQMRDAARRWVQEKDVNYTVSAISNVLNELLRGHETNSQTTFDRSQREDNPDSEPRPIH